MIATFLRHGSTLRLALGLLALAFGFGARFWPFSPLFAIVGALAFYCGEYGFRRFAFHAKPSRSAFVRPLQHRLHCDHHSEPIRLDLLFLPIWFWRPILRARR